MMRSAMMVVHCNRCYMKLNILAPVIAHVPNPIAPVPVARPLQQAAHRPVRGFRIDEQGRVIVI